MRTLMTVFALLFAAQVSGAQAIGVPTTNASTAARCSTLFSATTSVGPKSELASSGITEFPIQWTPRYPKRATPVLSDAQLIEIFKGVEMYSREHGRRALAYMKTLPKHFDSETRAHIWMEMAVFIVAYNRTVFVSDLYVLPGKRFLFRGGLGETLFIDADGTTYRTRTENLYDQKTWVADYSVLAPL